MGKVEAVIKSEIVRLARRELRKIAVPLGRDVRSLKNTISQLRKTVSALERFTALQKKEMGKKKPLEATPEEVQISRFSPRLIRSLRKRLRISQKELAILAGVTVGAIHQWESGMFKPSMKKKIVLVALRKLGRRDARGLLDESKAELVEKEIRKPRKRGKRKTLRK